MRQGALQAYQQVAALNLKVNFGHGLFASRRSLPVREHCRNAGGRWHWQRHECGRNRCVPLSLFTHPAVHHIRVQAMRQGHASYAGARLGAAFQHLCLELLAVLTPPWAVVIQRIFHRLHDPPSWGRCPLQAVFSRWDRQLHTHCLPSAKRQAPGAGPHKGKDGSTAEGVRGEFVQMGEGLHPATVQTAGSCESGAQNVAPPSPKSNCSRVRPLLLRRVPNEALCCGAFEVHRLPSVHQRFWPQNLLVWASARIVQGAE